MCLSFFSRNLYTKYIDSVCVVNAFLDPRPPERAFPESKGGGLHTQSRMDIVCIAWGHIVFTCVGRSARAAEWVLCACVPMFVCFTRICVCVYVCACIYMCVCIYIYKTFKDRPGKRLPLYNIWVFLGIWKKSTLIINIVITCFFLSLLHFRTQSDPDFCS